MNRLNETDISRAILDAYHHVVRDWLLLLSSRESAGSRSVGSCSSRT
jgi:hypothetical protein